MSNRIIAGCLGVSFLLLFVAEYTGDIADTLYSIGALGGLIFGVLAIRELNNMNKKAWFPYFYILITAVFWASAFVSEQDDTSTLGFIYLISGLIAIIELLRGKNVVTGSSGVSQAAEKGFLTIDKTRKASLIFGILIASISVAYYLVVFLPQKESARMEQQKQEQETQKTKEDAAATQKQKEYMATRKNDCYQIYTKERSIYSNVDGVEYDDTRDICVVIYTSNEARRSEKECDKILENINDTTNDDDKQFTSRAYTNCLNNTTSQDF